MLAACASPFIALTTAASEGAKAGFSLNDVRAHSRHASVLTLQRYLDQHNVAKTKRAIAELVAGALVRESGG